MTRVRDLEELDPVQRATRSARSRRRFVLAALALCAVIALYWCYVADSPRDFEDPRDHFKYGSIGSDVSARRGKRSPGAT